MICDETDDYSILYKEFASACSISSGFRWSNTEEVEIVTMDYLCVVYGIPKFCKIDVEGFESEVFAGLTNNIKFICFEFNEISIEDTKKCLDLLSSKNYRCNFIKYEFMKLVLNQWLPIKEFRARMPEIITSDILTGEIIIEYMGQDC